MCVADITIPQILWRRQVCLLVVPLIQKEQHSFSFRRYFQLQELHILFVWVALENPTQLTPIVISFCVNSASPLPFWFVPPWPYTIHTILNSTFTSLIVVQVPFGGFCFLPPSLLLTHTRLKVVALHPEETWTTIVEWAWQDVELMAVWRDKNV